MNRLLGRAILLAGAPTVTVWALLDGGLPVWARMAGMAVVGAACRGLWVMHRDDAAHRELDERRQELDARDHVLSLREATYAPVTDLVGDWPRPQSPRLHDVLGVPVMSWSGAAWDAAMEMPAEVAPALVRPVQRGRYRGVHAAPRDTWRWVRWVRDLFVRAPEPVAVVPSVLSDDWTMPTAEFQAGIRKIVAGPDLDEDHRRHEYAAASVLGMVGGLWLGMRGLR